MASHQNYSYGYSSYKTAGSNQKTYLCHCGETMVPTRQNAYNDTIYTCPSCSCNVIDKHFGDLKPCPLVAELIKYSDMVKSAGLNGYRNLKTCFQIQTEVAMFCMQYPNQSSGSDYLPSKQFDFSAARALANHALAGTAEEHQVRWNSILDSRDVHTLSIEEIEDRVLKAAGVFLSDDSTQRNNEIALLKTIVAHGTPMYPVFVNRSRLYSEFWGHKSDSRDMVMRKYHMDEEDRQSYVARRDGTATVSRASASSSEPIVRTIAQPIQLRMSAAAVAALTRQERPSTAPRTLASSSESNVQPIRSRLSAAEAARAAAIARHGG